MPLPARLDLRTVTSELLDVIFDDLQLPLGRHRAYRYVFAITGSEFQFARFLDDQLRQLFRDAFLHVQTLDR